MTNDELERLAHLLAGELRKAKAGTVTPGREPRSPAPWLPPTIRPVNPPHPTRLEAWSGAAQSLGDIAPVRGGSASPPRHRVETGPLTAAVRAAAAGKGGPAAADRYRKSAADGARVPDRRKGAARSGWRGAQVPIGVSNRHLHLAPEDASRLFGGTDLTVDRNISQPGQYAAAERVAVVGPSGRIEGVRVVGPNRGATQLELASSDARRIGLDPPVVASGHLQSSVGGVKLEGPSGTLHLGAGVIIAGRHLHISQDDARSYGLADGDVVSASCGNGSRRATLHGVLVRSGPTHATELHLDADEALACGVRTGDMAVIVSRDSARSPRSRTLVTERMIEGLAQRGEQVPPGALLTPSARDRAIALGLELP
ncbi:MAG: PduL/EutD family phosphate acyltransferase [Gemmatimonadota bacterium]